MQPVTLRVDYGVVGNQGTTGGLGKSGIVYITGMPGTTNTSDTTIIQNTTNTTTISSSEKKTGISTNIGKATDGSWKVLKDFEPFKTNSTKIGYGIDSAKVVISGIEDAYNATQTQGAEASYNKWKSGVKLASTTVGGIVGTLAGGNTMAGMAVGSAIGDALSDPIAKRATGYGITAETTEQYTERMQKINDAMEGYSEASKAVARQTNLTASEFEALKQTKLEEWYGDVSISAEEAADYASAAFRSIVDCVNSFV